MVNVKLSIILILSITINTTLNHECGSNSIEPILTIEKRRLQQSSTDDLSSYRSLRIKVDYSNFNNAFSNTPDMTLIKKVIDKVTTLYQKLLMVTGPSLFLFQTCKNNYGMVTPEKLKNTEVDADLLIFVYPGNISGLTAYASSCHLSGTNKRPNAGFIGINLDSLKFDVANFEDYLVEVIFHEVAHVLAFHNALFPYFWDNSNQKTIDISKTVIDKTINGISRKLLITPKVVQEARKHFNCDTLEGVELENQGTIATSGNHWETRLMYGELMNGTLISSTQLSRITLALFEDSGWYKVNYFTGGLFKFGKDAGCKFLEIPCVQNDVPEFHKFYCTKNGAPACLSEGKTKGSCFINEYQTEIKSQNSYYSNKFLGGLESADYCPVPISSSKDAYFSGNCAIGKISQDLKTNYGESIKDNSGCFMSNLSKNNQIRTAVCYDYTCNKNNLNVEIKYQDSASKTITISCPSKGGFISVNGFQGSLRCPSYNDICLSTTQCYNILDCVNKKSEDIPPVNLLESELQIGEYSVSLTGETDAYTNNFTDSIKINLVLIFLIILVMQLS